MAFYGIYCGKIGIIFLSFIEMYSINLCICAHLTTNWIDTMIGKCFIFISSSNSISDSDETKRLNDMKCMNGMCLEFSALILLFLFWVINVVTWILENKIGIIYFCSYGVVWLEFRKVKDNLFLLHCWRLRFNLCFFVNIKFKLFEDGTKISAVVFSLHISINSSTNTLP